MKNCVSTTEVLPNNSEGTTADLVSYQLVVVPPRKSIFMSRLSSCTVKEAIVEYLSNKLSEDDVRKCSVFKFGSARQRDIVASFKIIALAALKNLKVDERLSFRHMLDILYQTARGFNTKLRNVFVNAVNSDYLVVAFTETWIKPGIFEAEIFSRNLRNLDVTDCTKLVREC